VRAGSVAPMKRGWGEQTAIHPRPNSRVYHRLECRVD
jgi:hypothetical protein